MYYFYNPKTQYENLGDALIAKNLLTILSEKGSIKLNTSSVPSKFLGIIKNEKCEDVESSLVFLLAPFLLRLKGKQVGFVFKPGHLYGGGASIGGLKGFIAKILYVFLLNLFGVKILKTGVSIGPFDGLYLKYEKYVSKVSSFYGLRDDYSVDYAKKNNFPNFQRIADLGYFHEESSETEKTNITASRSICFTFRPFSSLKLTHKEQAIKLALIIKEIYISQPEIKSISCVTQVQRDFEFNNLIIKELELLNVKVEQNYLYDINLESYNEVANIYKSCELILSNRLHALLFAAEYGAIPVAIGDKIENFKVKYVLDDFEGCYFFLNVRAEIHTFGQINFGPDSLKLVKVTPHVFL